MTLELNTWKLAQWTGPITDTYTTPALDWLDAQVPSVVQQTLLEAGRIPNPHQGTLERDVQWVGEANWVYSTEFICQQGQVVFEGLDTFAHVYLNGLRVAQTSNMFVPLVLDVPAGSHQLVVIFENVFDRGAELEAKFGQGMDSWISGTQRLQVRKSAYHYGWDWGPTLVTAGIWKPAYWRSAPPAIAEVYPVVFLEQGAARIEVAYTAAGTVVAKLHDAEGTVVAQGQSDSGMVTLHVQQPKLWWPNGFGEAYLYTLTLEGEGASYSQRLGLRTVELIEQPLQQGSSFFFRVNGQDIFVGGANWIPDDNLIPRVSKERYYQRVQQAKDGNMCMLRVWGGGMYEHEHFYDACEELGIMVWQDFMFGCGIYPAHQEFMDNVEQEARANVLRLRGRTALVYWCGNNEDYEIAYSKGSYFVEREPEHNPEFPARMIYERLLPKVLAELDPSHPYKPGSSYGGGDPASPVEGDRHTWEVWHRYAEPYQNYKDFGGRFCSEFGMASAASYPLWERTLEPQDLQPFGEAFEHHNKAAGGPGRLARYVADNTGFVSGLNDYVYATQLVQAEAMRYAYNDWRKGFDGRQMGGALVWQLNDCWPVTSWAIIDSAGTVKPAWWTIKAALEPTKVVGRYAAGKTQVWLVSHNTWQGVLRMTTYQDGQATVTEQAVSIAANTTLELSTLNHPNQAVVHLQLLDGQTVINEMSVWSEPFKHHAQTEAKLDIRLEGSVVSITADRPVKGLWLEAEGATWSQNWLDLQPNRTYIFDAGVVLQQLKVQYWAGRVVTQHVNA